MLLEKLKERPQDKTLTIATVITSVPFFIITIIVFVLNELELKATTGYGVLEFELAWTPEMMQDIFAAWGQAEMEKQTIVTYIDIIYLVVYAFFGAETVLIVTRKLEGKLQTLGLYFTFATTLAAVFDMIENTQLLLMLSSPASISPSSPFIASICSIIKISFIELGMCFLSIAVYVLVIGKERMQFLIVALIGSGVVFTILLSIWSLLIALVGGPIYFILVVLTIQIIKKES